MKRRHVLGQLGALVASAVTRPAEARAEASGELRRHRIDSVTIRRVAQLWPRHVGKNAVRDVHGRGSRPEVVILKTDQGATGWGMPRGDGKMIRELEPLLKGKAVADLFDPRTGTDPRFRLFDIPLHDLAGVILGVPVWKMIGDRQEPLITRIYSGMIYFDELEPANRARGIDVLLEECRADWERGYRQVKVKIGRGKKWMPAEEGLKRDIEVVRAIHQAMPGCGILVDANNGYTVETAIRFLEGIKGVPLFWFEEPFHENPDDWRKLHAWMKANGFEKTYRADGEYAPDAPVLDLLGKEGVVNLRLEDIMSLGFTEWRRLLPSLAEMKVAASPHAWGAGLKSIYTGHLAAALGNIPTIEGVTCGDEDVLLGGNRIVEGMFHPSSKPGFGLSLKE